MAKRTSGEREQFWRDLIGRQPASGLSIAQFCKQTGVSANSFFVWKRRLRLTERSGPTVASRRSRSNVLVKRSRSNSPAAAASPLVPVRLLADPDRRRAPNAAGHRSRVAQWPRAASAGGVQWPRCPRRREGLGSAPRRREGIMLTFPTSLRVFAHRFATDMRKSFDGLCGIIEAQLGQTVESGDLFLFFNRRRDRVKILYFAGDSLVIVYRKLEAGTFETPARLARQATAISSSTSRGIEMRVSDLALILEGIELTSVRRRKRWRRETASA